MSNRDTQRRLDDIAMRYLAALEAGDFDAVDAFWAQADNDPELGEMLHGLNAELTAEQDATADDVGRSLILSAIRTYLPSAEVIGPSTGPITAGQVAEHLRRNPPRGLTADDLKLNGQLRTSAEVVPAALGVGQVVAWGRRFGVAPEAYWRAFREVALMLRMRRESAENYQIAARPTRPKSSGGNS